MQIWYVLKTIIVRLLIACVVSVASGGLAMAQHLKPHTAIYDVRLGTVTGSGTPSGLSGSMVYVVKDTCDGGFKQLSTLDVTIFDPSGRQSNLRQSFESFEAKDGLYSSFELKVVSNGQIVDAYKGEIEFDSRGGRMTYDHASGSAVGELNSQYDLQSGAQLSLNYTAAVVEEAQNGGRFFSRVVADGLLEGGPSRISAAIGNRLKEKASVSDPDSLLGEPAWPVQLAYYPTSSADSLPSQEMRVELYEGGIVGRIEQDMGGYSVRTELVDLQSAKGCAR